MEDYKATTRNGHQLMQTRGITLIHSSGEENPYKTILTEQEFCTILTEIHDN
jgi:hypothetical protein